jgi:hypothetical protein
MVNLLSKVRAIPSYLFTAIQELGAKFRKSNQLRILSLREISIPRYKANFENSCRTGIPGRADEVEIYILNEIFIHRETGLCLTRFSDRDWPVGIKESGLDTYTEFALRRKAFTRACSILESEYSTLEFDKPSYLFNVFLRKTNYHHFVKDNLGRLLTFLNNISEEVTILHFCERNGPIGAFFELIEEIYNCKFERISLDGSRHIRITSSVYFIGDTYLRFVNSPEHANNVFQRLNTDPQLEELGISVKDLIPVTHDDQIFPRSWRHTPTGTIYKNLNDTSLHFAESMFAVYEFGLEVIRKFNTQTCEGNVIYICREKGNTRKRIIGNESQLLDLAGIRSIDFAKYSLKEQISIANSCQVLIGLHGAGLVNSIFMQPGTSVIEIAPLGLSLPASNLFENICLSRDINYYRVYSSTLNEKGITNVNVDTLRHTLESLVEP